MMHTSKSASGGKGKKRSKGNSSNAKANNVQTTKRTTKTKDNKRMKPAIAQSSKSKREYKHSDQRGRRSEVHPDLNLGKVAEQAGISVGYLSKLLRGIGNPSIPTAKKVADAMGKSLPDFLEELEREQVKRLSKKSR